MILLYNLDFNFLFSNGLENNVENVKRFKIKLDKFNIYRIIKLGFNLIRGI